MAKSEVEHLCTWFCIIRAFVARDFLHLIFFWTGRTFKAIITFSFQLQLRLPLQAFHIPLESNETNPVNRQRGTLEKQAFETSCYNLFEIPKGNPQHFDDNTTMNAVITLWELLSSWIAIASCHDYYPFDFISSQQSYHQQVINRVEHIHSLGRTTFVGFTAKPLPIAVWITILAKSHRLASP